MLNATQQNQQTGRNGKERGNAPDTTRRNLVGNVLNREIISAGIFSLGCLNGDPALLEKSLLDLVRFFKRSELRPLISEVARLQSGKDRKDFHSNAFGNYTAEVVTVARLLFENHEFTWEVLRSSHPKLVDEMMAMISQAMIESLKKVKIKKESQEEIFESISRFCLDDESWFTDFLEVIMSSFLSDPLSIQTIFLEPELLNQVQRYALGRINTRHNDEWDNINYKDATPWEINYLANKVLLHLFLGDEESWQDFYAVNADSARKIAEISQRIRESLHSLE